MPLAVAVAVTAAAAAAVATTVTGVAATAGSAAKYCCSSLSSRMLRSVHVSPCAFDLVFLDKQNTNKMKRYGRATW